MKCLKLNGHYSPNELRKAADWIDAGCVPDDKPGFLDYIPDIIESNIPDRD